MDDKKQIMMQPKNLRIQYSLSYDGYFKHLEIHFTGYRDTETEKYSFAINKIMWHGRDVFDLILANEFGEVYLEIQELVGASTKSLWAQAEDMEQEQFEQARMDEGQDFVL